MRTSKFIFILFCTVTSVAAGITSAWASNVSTTNPCEVALATHSPKTQFIKDREALLHKMIRQGLFTMSDLREASLSAAESFVNGAYHSFGDVMIIGDNVFAFDRNDFSKVQIVNRLTPGFLSHEVQALRLDKKQMLIFMDNNTVVLLPVESKDPAGLDHASPGLDPLRAEILLNFKSELQQLLLTTTFTLQDFAEGLVEKGQIRESGNSVYLFIVPKTGLKFYLTQKPADLDPTNRKHLGFFNESQLGFKQSFDRHIDFQGGESLHIVNGKMISDAPNAATTKAVIDSIQNALATIADQPNVAAAISFLHTHETALQDLMAHQILSIDLREIGSLMTVKNPITEETYAVMKTASGYVAFGENLPKRWSYLRDLDKTLPCTWFTSGGQRIVIHESIGFQKSVVEDLLGQ